MARWQYCRVGSSNPYQVTFLGVHGSQTTILKRDKSKGDQNDADAYDRTIAELGTQGWEAVGYAGMTATILFKRELV